jgi:hypothetical protein
VLTLLTGDFSVSVPLVKVGLLGYVEMDIVSDNFGREWLMMLEPRLFLLTLAIWCRWVGGFSEVVLQGVGM